MAITLTNTGWFGVAGGVPTSGVWSNSVDSVLFPEEIVINPGTIAKTLGGNDAISGNGFANFSSGIRNFGTIDTGAGLDLIAARGYFNGLENNGTIDTGANDDTIKGSAVFGAAISNNGTINVGGGNNFITGTSGTPFYGILNTNQIIAEGGNDTISGIGEGYGIWNLFGTINAGGGDNFIAGQSPFGVGIYNAGEIETGNGRDTIIGRGDSGAPSLQNEGMIKTGGGDDIIRVTSFDGQTDVVSSIYNIGTIDTGSGNDQVIAKGGFSGNGSVFLGTGNDYLTGFGNGYFDGGKGTDTLELAANFYTIGISGTTVNFTDLWGSTMFAADFERFIIGTQTYSLATLPNQITG